MVQVTCERNVLCLKIDYIFPRKHFFFSPQKCNKCLFPDYTDLAMSTVTQRLSVRYTGTVALLQYYLNQLSGDLEQTTSQDRQIMRVFKSVNVIVEPRMVVIEVNLYSDIDMFYFVIYSRASVARTPFEP